MSNGPEVVGLQLEILCFIADKYEPDVAALVDEYNRWHEEEIEYTSVYAAVERLHELGYVSKKPIDGRSNCYMLTSNGAKLLVTHRELVLEHTDRIKEAVE